MTDREKIIYDILCSDKQPPEGQHWEGFVASKIAAALAQPEQEPVAWMYDWYDETEDIDGVPIGGIVHDCISKDYDEAHSPTMGCHNIRPLYTAPPQREWQGLTADQQAELVRKYKNEPVTLVFETEAKLREKNT